MSDERRIFGHSYHTCYRDAAGHPTGRSKKAADRSSYSCDTCDFDSEFCCLSEVQTEGWVALVLAIILNFLFWGAYRAL